MDIFQMPFNSVPYGVPQCSVLGPLLLILYTLPLLVQSYLNSMLPITYMQTIHKFTWNLTLGTSILVSLNSYTTELPNCLKAVQALMGNIKLKLNSDMTEFIVIDDKIRSSMKSSFPVILLGNIMEEAESVKNFGCYPGYWQLKDIWLNAWSLHNKASAFGDFVSSNDLDMVGVTETWLRPSDTQGLIDEITPVGFQLHHVPCRNKKGGGVAVCLDSVLCQTDQRDTFEHTTVKLSERQSSQLLKQVIYRPLSTNKSKFIEDFTCFMQAAALSPHENIILGDVDIQLDSENCWTDNFKTVLSDFDFIQHVSTPMHIQGHILDVLCTSKSLSSVHHYVKDSISNHLAVFFTTAFLVKNSCRVKRLKIRKLSKINRLLIKQPAYYHTSIFIPSGIYWTSTQLYMNAKLHNMPTKGS